MRTHSSFEGNRQLKSKERQGFCFLSPGIVILHSVPGPPLVRIASRSPHDQRLPISQGFATKDTGALLPLPVCCRFVRTFATSISRYLVNNATSLTRLLKLHSSCHLPILLAFQHGDNQFIIRRIHLLVFKRFEVIFCDFDRRVSQRLTNDAYIDIFVVG